MVFAPEGRVVICFYVGYYDGRKQVIWIISITSLIIYYDVKMTRKTECFVHNTFAASSMMLHEKLSRYVFVVAKSLCPNICEITSRGT